MKSPPLWRVSVATSREGEDAIADLLQNLFGQPASSWLDLDTGISTISVYLSSRVFQPGAPAARRRLRTGPAADRHRSPQQMRKEILARLGRIRQCGLKVAPGKVTIARLRAENWAESWKRHFRPIEIGSTLLVKPGWSRKKPRSDQAVVILNPGLSFGTGQHPTTHFCLRALARGGKNGARRSFLDIGTGSGILAIAAARLGYSPVEAIDFDPQAVQIARANAQANRVDRQIRIRCGDVTKLRVNPARRYDFICANLMADLLISECRRIAAQLKPGGTLVLAGILKSEFRAVQTAFAKAGLKLAFAKTVNEWRSGSFLQVGR